MAREHTSTARDGGTAYAYRFEWGGGEGVAALAGLADFGDALVGGTTPSSGTHVSAGGDARVTVASTPVWRVG
ncbi:MAG: hypothetical protein IAG13_21160 [Deltaproteobacteria bacterium]|nr:hypothetical protein [Nannocystaceae bacterium]